MKVFLSYSAGEDEEQRLLVRRLAEALRNGGLEPFLDVESLRLGNDWRERLEAELVSCDAGICVLSRRALSSEWVARELTYLVRRPAFDPDFLFVPIVLGDIRTAEIKASLKGFDVPDYQLSRVEETSDWLEKLVKRFQEAWKARLTRDGALNAYLEALRGECDTLSFLSSLGVSLPSLSSIYIPQRPIPRPSRSSETRRSPTLDAPHALDLLKGHGILLIEGRPGVGKTTLMNHLVLSLIERWSQGDDRSLLPVSVRAPFLVGAPASLSECLHESVKNTLGLRLRDPLSPDFFSAAPTRDARWLVFVDGLDEVLDPRARGDLINMVKGLARRPDLPHRFAVLTRPIPELGRAPDEVFSHYELRPLNARELSTFAEKWFRAQPDSLSEDAGAFLSLLRGRTRELARYPLLLTLAAIAYQFDRKRALGSSRVALYEQFVELLLKRDAESEAADGIRADLARVLGKPAATRLLDKRRLLLELLAEQPPDAQESLVPTAARIALSQGWVPDDVNGAWLEERMETLLRRTGLVVLDGSKIRFFHATFVEFLAASAVARRLGHPRAVIRRIKRRWASEHETTLFLLGLLADPDTSKDVLGETARPDDLEAVLRKLVRSGRKGRRLAGLALAEGVPVSRELEKQILSELVALARRFDQEEFLASPNCFDALKLLVDRPEVIAGCVEAITAGEADASLWWSNEPVEILIEAGAVEELRRIAESESVRVPLRLAAARDLSQEDPELARWLLTRIARVGADRGIWSTEVKDALLALRSLRRVEEVQALALFAARQPETLGAAASVLAELGKGGDAEELLITQLQDPDIADSKLQVSSLIRDLDDLGAAERCLPLRGELYHGEAATEILAHWLLGEGRFAEANSLFAELDLTRLDASSMEDLVFRICLGAGSDEVVDRALAITRDDSLDFRIREQALEAFAYEDRGVAERIASDPSINSDLRKRASDIAKRHGRDRHDRATCAQRLYTLTVKALRKRRERWRTRARKRWAEARIDRARELVAERKAAELRDLVCDGEWGDWFAADESVFVLRFTLRDKLRKVAENDAAWVVDSVVLGAFPKPIQAEAIRALAEAKAVDPLRELASASSSPPWMAILSIRGLASNDRHDEVLSIARSAEFDPWVRRSAARTLAESPVKQCGDLLRDTSVPSAIRKHAAWALVGRPGPSGARKLQEKFSNRGDESFAEAIYSVVVMADLLEE